jgi:hypothetical protein
MKLEELEKELRKIKNTHPSHSFEQMDENVAAIVIQKLWRGFYTRKQYRNRSSSPKKSAPLEYKPSYDITRIMLSIQQKSLASKEVVVSKEKLQQNIAKAKELLSKSLLDWIPEKQTNLVERIEFWLNAIRDERVEEKSSSDPSATPDSLLEHKLELRKAGGAWWNRAPETLNEDTESWLSELERDLVDTGRYY